jgi:hypothetical protein
MGVRYPSLFRFRIRIWFRIRFQERFGNAGQIKTILLFRIRFLLFLIRFLVRYPSLFRFRFRIRFRIRFQERYGNAGQIKTILLFRIRFLLFRIRFLVRYERQIKILSCLIHTEEYTVHTNHEKFKTGKMKFESLEVPRKICSKGKAQNNRFKHKFLCLDMEWNGYLYTGFKWENGWPTEAGSNTITGPASPGSSTPAVPAVTAVPSASVVLSTAPPSPEMDTTPLVSTAQPTATTGQLQQQPDIGIQVNTQEPHSKEEKADAKSSYTGTTYITSQVSDESDDKTDERNTM